MNISLEVILAVAAIASGVASVISALTAKAARDDSRRASDDARSPQFTVWPTKRIDDAYDRVSYFILLTGPQNLDDLKVGLPSLNYAESTRPLAVRWVAPNLSSIRPGRQNSPPDANSADCGAVKVGVPIQVEITCGTYTPGEIVPIRLILESTRGESHWSQFFQMEQPWESSNSN
jgi:hypothetical protein